MSLYTIIPEETPDNNSNWTKREKAQYRFGGYRYSFKGPTYPQETVMENTGWYAFPKEDGVTESNNVDN